MEIDKHTSYSEKSLYSKLVAAGIEVSNHESDLYFPVNDKTRGIVREFKSQKCQNIKTFTSNIDGKRMYSASFMFDPFWEKHGM